MRRKIIRMLALCAGSVMMLQSAFCCTENVVWASEEDSYYEEESGENIDSNNDDTQSEQSIDTQDNTQSDNQDTQNSSQSQSDTQEDDAKWPDSPKLDAKNAVLMNADNGVILYNKNKDESATPGNLTKYMTALVLIENKELTDNITMSYEALEKTGDAVSALSIQEGEELTVEECLYIMLIESADEIANQVAISVSGSVEGFVTLMNQKAQELGCTHTNFLNSTGQEVENQISSANDIALILAAAYKNEKLQGIMSQPVYTVAATNKSESRTIANHMVFFQGEEQEYSGMLAGREGVVGENEYYLVALASRNEVPLIAVVLKDIATENRNDTRDLLDYGFHNFKVQDLSQGMEIIEKGQGMIPNDVTIEELKTIMVQESSGHVHIWYYYGDYNVGELLTTPASYNAFLDPEAEAAKQEEQQQQVTQAEVQSNNTAGTDEQKQKLSKIRKYIIYVLIGLIILSIVLIIIILISRALDRARKRKSRRRRR